MTTEFKDALDKAAQLSAAERMRLARQILQGLELETRESHEGDGFTSVFDVAGDLIGSVESGVPDLATNPKYLDDLGQSAMS